MNELDETAALDEIDNELLDELEAYVSLGPKTIGVVRHKFNIGNAVASNPSPSDEAGTAGAGVFNTISAEPEWTEEELIERLQYYKRPQWKSLGVFPVQVHPGGAKKPRKITLPESFFDE